MDIRSFFKPAASSPKDKKQPKKDPKKEIKKDAKSEPKKAPKKPKVKKHDSENESDNDSIFSISNEKPDGDESEADFVPQKPRRKSVVVDLDEDVEQVLPPKPKADKSSKTPAADSKKRKIEIAQAEE